MGPTPGKAAIMTYASHGATGLAIAERPVHDAVMQILAGLEHASVVADEAVLGGKAGWLTGQPVRIGGGKTLEGVG